MERVYVLAGLVGYLALAGCNRPTPPTVVIVTQEFVAEPTLASGRQLFDSITRRGVSGELSGRYRFACEFNGTVLRPSSSVDLRLALAPISPDKPNPESVALYVSLESETLPRRAFQIDTAKVNPKDEIVIEKREQVIVVTIANVYNTGPSSKKNMPIGRHKITLSVGLDEKDSKPLKGAFHLVVMERG